MRGSAGTKEEDMTYTAPNTIEDQADAIIALPIGGLTVNVTIRE